MLAMSSLAMFVFISVTPAQMAVTVQNRLAALDHLDIEYSVTQYWYPRGTSVCDRDAWSRDEDSLPVHYHHAQLVRPILFDHLQMDYPGYPECFFCFKVGEAVLQQVASLDNGRTRYIVVEKNLGAIFFVMGPVLQAFDLDLLECWDRDNPRFDIVDLLLKPNTTVLREEGGITTFETADVPRPGGDLQHFEYDLTANGTPMRVLAQMDFHLLNGMTRRYMVEQHILQTETINGYEFPTEIVLATSYPEEESRRPSLWCIDVSSVSHTPELTVDDVTLTPNPVNCEILTEYATGGSLMEVYDETGALIRNDAFPPGGLACGDAKPRELARVTPDSTSRSSIVKPILGTVGVLVLGVAVLVAVRMRH